MNCILTIISTTAGLIWKGQKGEENMTAILMVAFPAVLILPVALFFLFEKIEDSSGLDICIKHEDQNCDVCRELYGFYVKRDRYMVCRPHHTKLPCAKCAKGR